MTRSGLWGIRIVPFAILGLFSACAPSEEGPVSASRASALTHGGFIVVLEDHVDPGVEAAAATDRGLAVGHVYRHALKGFSFRGAAAAAAALARRPGVAWVEPDQVATIVARPDCSERPDHPSCGGGEEDPPPAANQEVPWGVTRVGGPVDGTGRTAWIIDTGIDLDHPDLNVDLARSVNFVNTGKNSPDDANGHGTHVAGTIGARDNDFGVVGVAAGANVVAVRVLDRNGSGAYSWVIAGVDYVAQTAAAGDVANMSLGGPPSDALDLAVSSAASQGVLFSLAAGNESAPASESSPARVEHLNAYTVSAVDETDCFAWFSNYGAPPVDVAAPGVAINSTFRRGGYEVLNGTSMAAPHVAGVLLLGELSTLGQVAPAENCVDGGDPDGDPDPIAHFPEPL